jgi:hypothetical protein
VPTREDVLAIRSIDEAFDLSTATVMPWELALIRVAAQERLIDVRGHAFRAADRHAIQERDVLGAVRLGNPASKDIDLYGPRQVGINFERTLRDGRRIRVKVSWDRRHYTVTVHTI